jgi:quercetin dioxygenase-like cupin family protein
VWLFTLGSSGGSSAKAIKIAEVGPIPRINATQYLLRINDASGPPGSATSVHSHPGSEAFFVLTGEQSIRGARNHAVKAGQLKPARGGSDAGVQ